MSATRQTILYRGSVMLCASVIGVMLFFIGECERAAAQASTPTPVCADRVDKATMPFTVTIHIGPDPAGENFANEWPGGPYNIEDELRYSFSLNDYVAGVVMGELGPQLPYSHLPGEAVYPGTSYRKWHESAVKALAIAARSMGWYRLNYAGQFGEPHEISCTGTITCYDGTEAKCGFWDYSTDPQVFRPYHGCEYIPPNYEYVCPPELSLARAYYADIVTATQHLFIAHEYLNWNQPIGALYDSTVGAWTEAGGVTEPWLQPVYNPISPETAPPSRRGMGQWGLQRWSQGRTDRSDAQSFPAWPDYQQMIAHFYHRIQVIDYHTHQPVTPPYRWNALRMTPTVPTMIAGASYPFTLTIQNTGIYSWTAGEYAIGYEWRDATGAMLAAGSPVTLTAEVLPGAPLTLTLPITAPLVTTRGTYTLAWDLRGADGAWFQAQDPPWFPQDIAVVVQPRCAYTLPLTPTLGTGEYPEVVYDSERTEYLVVWGADDAVRGRIVWRAGEATNISFTLSVSV